MNDLPVKKTLLVIDDDPFFCDAVRETFCGTVLEVFTAYTAAAGLDICRNINIDIVLLDENLPDRQGHLICAEILELNEQCKILFITAHPSFEHAIQAIRSGAHDYLLKPFELEELHLSVERALQMNILERAQLLQSYKASKDQENSIMVGMLGQRGAASQIVRRAAEVRSPILITGETGTGKTVLARHIHYGSMYREAPFVFVNCATLPENLIESELFGHERGAFTGAVSSRKGVFELAEGGTLFLDEIATMPLHLQTKLLATLDNGSLRRLGGQSEIRVTVRIIAATNADLESLIRDNLFRRDLYYRLNVLSIHIPPLRERPEDISELCRHFVTLLGRNPKRDLDDREIGLLRQYDWPGNARELRNILERSCILHPGRLRPSELLFGLKTQTENRPSISPPTATINQADTLTLEEIEQCHILDMLQRQRGNITRTAKALGISLSTLKRKIKRYQKNR